MKSISLANSSIRDAEINVIEGKFQYIFDYPCKSNSVCTDYVLSLAPGVYKFELYGASGGSARNVVSTYRFENNTCISDAVVRRYNGNTACLQMSSIGGAGGYISGKIRIPRETVTFLTVGGKGIYSHTLIEMSTARCFSRKYMIPGEYGGGGGASNFCDVEGSEACGTGSGGGQTAVKFSENDLWHRVMVSGGGGGTDNIFGTFGGNEDGSGGAGGNLVAQSWFAGGVLQKQYFADSTKGFTFGTGEGARYGTPKNNKAVPNGNNVDNGGAGAVGLVALLLNREMLVQVVEAHGL
ncbi:hypothetical protein TVAG_356230 [Trichomonas vaginalis G3]|uniref:receptor protein-tyrosine kinase n=1 Tax=Trichomonas vaginalis (strain ATCC PRA-98 / G3) TaxID=412133 RepID=A2G1H4_TRIV3|nr:glycine-rich protein family [Trichomonas vaginalis G3]EAX88988.1 hypothetical protein TVAG_356230 [Trichomonas vaginalis G3]KAI5516052.1 glycine-rich protein family [Trichomonas vaginalis G3]|eukprot:XP_001301918.1 hypothetical protein [Trichomonas vaginalis G3]